MYHSLPKHIETSLGYELGLLYYYLLDESTADVPKASVLFIAVTLEIKLAFSYTIEADKFSRL